MTVAERKPEIYFSTALHLRSPSSFLISVHEAVMNSRLFVILSVCVVLLFLQSSAVEMAPKSRMRRADGDDDNLISPDNPAFLVVDLLDQLLGSRGLAGVLGSSLGRLLGK
ncbi:hypothetical protein NPIL_304121 [Nephila pilipes]|uniref:Uncharacterized protein n=1 Tax=Nephila pilipes TaxID=299642 RepID=A0A8X6NT18_NEPPI|nr:hypothetical protein NPIL_304121 [Nephila pilipes]